MKRDGSEAGVVLVSWQRLALLVVLFVAISVGLAIGTVPSGFHPSYAATATSLQLQLAALNAEAPQSVVEDFPFDPNTVTGAELLRLGLSEKRAAAWLKFRGSRERAFRGAEDIRKLYVLDDATKDRLVGLARVAPVREEAGEYTRVQSFGFDPNQIGKSDLRRLGLSSKEANIYISYRAKIDGGFARAAQLARLPFLNDTMQIKLSQLAEFAPPPALTLKANFVFDPNTVSADSLKMLGFPAYQVKGLIRYRGDRRVTFRKPEDIRRVKSLDSLLVELAIPLISIAPFPPNSAPASAPKTYANYSSPPPPGSININTADTSTLQTLPGVGTYRAGAIVRYRDALGGFYSTDQLRNTRGLPDSTYQGILPYLQLGRLVPNLRINTAGFAELNRHPNINRKQANAVVRFREKHGPFSGPDDLRRIRLFNDDNLAGILPYLSYATE